MRFFKTISDGLCSLGGADIAILNECPSSERKKFWISSLTNFYQSIVSSIAMAVTFFSIKQDLHPLAVFSISIVFGAFCFLINLGLTGSISKKQNPLEKFGLLVLRIVISVIISLLSSQVLEISVFKDSFPYARRKQEIAVSQTLQNTMGSMLQEKETLKTELENIDMEIDASYRERNSFFESDSILADHLNQHQILQSRLDSLTTQYRSLNNETSERLAPMQLTIASLNNELNSLDTEEDQRRIDSLNSQIAALNNSIAQESTERNRRNAELNNLQQRINAKETEIQERRIQIDSDNRGRTGTLSAKRELAAAALTKAEAGIANFTMENNQAASDSFLTDGLINDLLTLQYIQTWKDDEHATFEERAIAQKVFELHIMIMAIFLLGDLSPLLIMLFHKPGVYEDKKEKELEAEAEIADIAKSEKIEAAQVDIKSKRRFTESRRESERTKEEIENMSNDSVIFSELQTKTFEKIQKVIHSFIGKDIDNHQKQSEVADTEQAIWNTLNKMRKHVSEMFWLNQNRSRKNFDGIEDNAS